MKNRVLSGLWAGMFIVCAILGFIPDVPGWLGVCAALLFFLPPALLLKNRAGVALIRNLACWSLGLTLALMVLGILTAPGGSWLGDFLHGVLTVVSVPMVCSGYWALSLFLWACLLTAARGMLKKKKKTAGEN